MDTSQQRRCSFDAAALSYDQVRPGYPAAMFDDLLALAQLPPDGRILEIGCGTGQATLPLAQRGYYITCIELGAHLATIACHNLAAYPHVEIWNGAFEARPCAEATYHMVFAATSFHWIDPALRYLKAVQALKMNGTLALCWNKHVQCAASGDFFSAVQQVYRRVAPAMAQGSVELPHPAAVTEPIGAAMANIRQLGPVDLRRYSWEACYSAERYIDLLSTYSDHHSLDATTRAQLFAGIAELINTQFGGSIVKGYVTLLYTARRQ